MQAGAGRSPDPLVAAAWWRLQRGAGRVDAVARELGVSRRYLQEGFRRQIGLAPLAVARIARLQRAIHRLSRGAALQAAAVDSGYADQPHLNRSMRAMTGLTPGELRAFVQYPPPEAV
jgi:AraC-like DNA-binding protein